MPKERAVSLAPVFCQEVWTGSPTQNQREEHQFPGSALLYGSLGQCFKQEAMTGWKGKENDEWKRFLCCDQR